MRVSCIPSPDFSAEGLQGQQSQSPSHLSILDGTPSALTTIQFAARQGRLNPTLGSRLTTTIESTSTL